MRYDAASREAAIIETVWEALDVVALSVRILVLLTSPFPDSMSVMWQGSPAPFHPRTGTGPWTGGCGSLDKWTVVYGKTSYSRGDQTVLEECH
ncbi:hypothetical protein TNCV_3982771 [Trichonephila clavipes]|nr:hypothetical protein TNCV_3982771 [Trichonephila clavipes]